MIYRFSFFLMSAVFLAAAPLQAQQLKIGVIDMQKALNETEEGKEILAEMKEKLTRENKELQRKQEELKKMQDELTRQAFLLSENVRTQKEEEFRRLGRDLERFREDKRTEFVRLQQLATEKIHRGLMKILSEFAKAEKYDMLVEAGQQAEGLPGAILYFDETMDITDKIIELYNRKTGEKAEKK